GLVRVNLGQLQMHPGLTMAEGIDIRKTGLFESVEVAMRVGDVSLERGSDLLPLKQISITTGLLPMLGVQPVIGRPLSEDDIPPPLPPPPPPVPGGPPPPLPVFPTQRALVDYDTWQTHFGADPDVPGQMITLNGFRYEIIGVLPRGFRLVTGRAIPQRIDFYVPFRLQDNRGAWFNTTLVKVKRGDAFAAPQQGLDALAADLLGRFPDTYNHGSLRYVLTPALEDMTRQTRPALRAAIGAVLLLLLVAFVNAAALVVARLRARETDLAVRTALGASPRALMFDLIVEGALLAGAGFAAGTLAGWLSLSAIRQLIPRSVPRWDQIGVGWDLLSYAGLLALAGFVLAGVLPAWRRSRGVLVDAIRSGSAQGGRAASSRSRLVLVGAQIAVTVVLAFGGVQLVRSAAALSRVDLGYDPNVLTANVAYEFRRYRTNEARAQLYQRIRDRVRQVPGVDSVGVVTNLPLSGLTMMAGYETDLTKPPTFGANVNYQGVTPGYFAAMKIPIVQGRDFTDQEDATRQAVIVVDETLARQAFPGEANVVGRMLRLGWGGLGNARIVGVVGHARTIEVGRAVRPQVYAPIGNLFSGQGIVVVRGTGTPRELETEVRRAIHEIGTGRAVTEVRMLTEFVTAATSTLVAVTGLVSFLAVSAAVLSAVGLYLVLSFVVFQRRRSTAIRTALGASRGQVIWQHVKTSAWVTTIALSAGVLLAAAAAPWVADLTYGVDVRDPSSMAVAISVAAIVSMGATIVPVLRAASTNIVEVLRGE
ncbi:MAG TPA: FtsX-like permease family protein, partial [Vicinamibacterales bacterium]|nr:FtsX-like permease family protein [Vicinamibacterales bacterium]